MLGIKVGSGGAVGIEGRMLATEKLALARAFLDFVDDGIETLSGDRCALVSLVGVVGCRRLRVAESTF